MHTVETPEEMKEILDRAFVIAVALISVAGLGYLFVKWQLPIAWPLG